jgi:hypothetical protein
VFHACFHARDDAEKRRSDAGFPSSNIALPAPEVKDMAGTELALHPTNQEHAEGVMMRGIFGFFSHLRVHSCSVLDKYHRNWTATSQMCRRLP